MEASAEERQESFIDFSRLTIGELLGMLGALVLAGSLFLPWFSTSENPNSRIASAQVGPDDVATAWQTFPILRWALLAACIAPFILAWIILRGHDLTWKPGEITMIVGMIAFMLILCNGIILGKPEPGIEIGLSWGYLVGLIGAMGLMVAGFLRQSRQADTKQPPGTF
jgi:hypothetical protein